MILRTAVVRFPELVMTRLVSVVVLAALLMFSGCDDPSRLAAGGLLVEPQAAEVQPAARNQAPDDGLRAPADEVARDDDNLERHGRSGWGRDRQMPSNAEDWGDDREMPSDRMPSQRQVAGSDREMPSDSMPSRAEKWGKDRALPSDSPNWGKDRKMPSDTAFRRSTQDEQDESNREPTDKSTQEPSDE